MSYLKCRERVFPFRINVATFYVPYLRWLKHLGERLGVQNTLLAWKNTFAKYDNALLVKILSTGWKQVIPDEINPEDSINESISDFLSTTNLDLSEVEIRNLIEYTPPITQIRQYFSSQTVEKEITAFEALHFRFDGLAHLAEALIKNHGKQGEIIVYDMMVEGRVAANKGETCSVEEFIDGFTAEDDTPSLFTAGQQTEVIRKTPREAVLYVRECEWARYFQEKHPNVGYLLACSTDEVSYRSLNQKIRMQRTSTLMEGGEICDFRIYAIDAGSNSEN